MNKKAFQKIYTQLEAITKATVSLKAKGVSNDELATVDGRLAQVVKTKETQSRCRFSEAQKPFLPMRKWCFSAPPLP
jgi:hypothetical protein